MHIRSATLVSTLALLAAAPALAQEAAPERAFNRIASFAVATNSDGAEETSAEIIAATGDGMTLVYSDSPLGVIGLIDITDPAAPAPLGTVAMQGEPTSVAARGDTILVAVNTSESFVAPSGFVAALDAATRTETARCDIGGQPDSTAIAPDGSFAAIAIENERDEDAGDGRVGQMPGGTVALIDMTAAGALDCASLRYADVTGLAEIAPEDPEPEFVDINAEGEIVVTLQENNHIVVLDRTGAILSHFSAGIVELAGIDASDEQAALIFDEAQAGVPREPDGVKWIDATHFAIANEGDMDGGTRGWTVMAQDGTVIWDAGTSFEYALIEAGHYPDRRSDAKGVEPEGLAFADVDGTPMLFVLGERASAVGVYDMTDPAAPVLTQILASGVAPEGAVAIPARGLFATANEADLGADGLARSHVMLYQMQDGAPVYPQLTSAGADELIGWAALSGLAAGPQGTLYAVNDSFFGHQPTIFTIDTTATPARITTALRVTRNGHPAQKIDMEGIAVDPEGGFWIASEGRTDRLIPHAIIHVGADGEIDREIGFPAELLASETRFGAEGIALIDGRLWIALQRDWADDAGNMVKLVSFDLETEEWGAIAYERAASTAEGGWVGLSEIAVQGDWVYLIERDNQIGALAATKLITRVPLSEMVPAPLGSALPVVTREVVLDLLPTLTSTGGYILDKVEGLAFDAAGDAWIVTDNDGVDDSSGETMLVNLGAL